MPCSLIFHEGDTFSLDCLSQDGGGLSFDPACELEGGLQLCKIVTIDCQNLRAEVPEFCVDRIWRIDLLQRSIALDMIVVQDDDQIILP